MDYFGRVVEELSDLWEEVHASRHSTEARDFLKALDKAMAAAAKVERTQLSPPNAIAPEEPLRQAG